MRIPPVPYDEPKRLASLHALGIMYTAAEERYDRITRLAQRLLDVPIALLTLVDERAAWFKSAQGIASTETPREASFCGHAILTEETFVVEDAAQDERFSDNPLVTGDPEIRFYAGEPVHSLDGMIVGSLCIVDREPRTLSAQERATLRDLAAFVEAEMHREHLHASQRAWLAERDRLVRKASIDDLSHAWNRGTILELFNAELGRAARGQPLSVAMIDIDHFKAVNDDHGHQTGDRVIAETAASVRRAVRDFDLLGRYGGEEFLVLLGDCPASKAIAICERIRANVAALAIESAQGSAVPVTVSIGVSTYSPANATAAALIAAADEALYRAKQSGRNRVEPGPCGTLPA